MGPELSRRMRLARHERLRERAVRARRTGVPERDPRPLRQVRVQRLFDPQEVTALEDHLQRLGTTALLARSVARPDEVLRYPLVRIPALCPRLALTRDDKRRLRR